MLLVDDDGATHGVKDALRDGELLCGAEGSAAEGGDARADHGGSVGHGAHDGEFAAGAMFDRRNGDGGREGDEQLVPGQPG